MRAKAGPLALVVIVALAVGALVIGRTVLRDDDDCGALAEPVAGLDGYAWDNGITSSGAEWLSVLTQGVTDADGPSRSEIAATVEADPEGYDRFRAALPDALQPEADRLHELALDPDSDRTAPSVGRDARALSRHGTLTCNLA